MKLLSAKYKTVEGARKRCAFENALARGEYQRGDKAKIYHYTVVQDDNSMYRVARDKGVVDAEFEAKLASYSSITARFDELRNKD